MATVRLNRLPEMCNIEFIQLDPLVSLKVIKHCHEEGAGTTDIAQGVLLGLVVENRLEITNCFPFPRHTDEEDFDEVEYQMEMMRHLRQVNIDHLHVGWYQSTYYGGYLNKTLLDSQFSYQNSIEESVVLIYDPLRTARGFLSLKAFRLTPAMMQLYRDGEFSPESVRNAKITFGSMFEELKIVMKNSHMVNVLCCELSENIPEEKGNQFLNLATGSVLEKHLRSLMDCVDEQVQETNKLANFLRSSAKQQQAKQQYLHKREQDNNARVSRGEAALPEEELTKLFKPIPAPGRLDSLLYSGQITSYCQQIAQFATQSLGKLFISEGFQRKSDNAIN
uniref:Eukaryotic translation initiation factor 3 subunit H n=1 Tax=Strigamia maritima TaxID=126957 RepID=T1IRT5_STRMM